MEGGRFPLGVASAGLAILAFMPARERRRYLEQVDLAAAWGREHAPGPVAERLQATRTKGYAFNPGLIVPGSWGVAAAVFDHDDRPLGAISLTGIADRFDAARRDVLGGQLLKAALVLSRQLKRQAQREFLR